MKAMTEQDSFELCQHVANKATRKDIKEIKKEIFMLKYHIENIECGLTSLSYCRLKSLYMTSEKRGAFQKNIEVMNTPGITATLVELSKKIVILPTQTEIKVDRVLELIEDSSKEGFLASGKYSENIKINLYDEKTAYIIDGHHTIIACILKGLQRIEFTKSAAVIRKHNTWNKVFFTYDTPYQ